MHHDWDERYGENGLATTSSHPHAVEHPKRQTPEASFIFERFRFCNEPRLESGFEHRHHIVARHLLVATIEQQRTVSDRVNVSGLHPQFG